VRRIRLNKINIREIPLYIKGGIVSAGKEMSRLRGTNVWIFIMYGLLLDTVNNLWRPFSAKFLERLGGGELEIALLNALPGAVAAIVLLPGAMIFRRFSNKQRATAAFILASRALLLGIALIPALPPAVRPMLFVILLAIMNCPDALSQTSLQSFLGDVFSGTTRGEAIALRNKFGQAIIPVVTISTGLLITFLPRTDEQRMVLYQIFFVLAFIFGVLEVMVFRRLKAEKRHPVLDLSHGAESRAGARNDGKPPSDWALIPIILKDRRFLAFFIPIIIFMFTWQAGWPLVAIHQVMTIQATELWFAIFGVASSIGAFVSAGLWQRGFRKYSNSKIIIISCLFLSGNMFLFPITPNVQLMAFLSFFTGLSMIGINTSLLNGVLEATPDENRMVYLAFYNTVTSISLFIAPFFAHALLSWLGNNNAMFIVGSLRFAATGVIAISFKYFSKQAAST